MANRAQMLATAVTVAMTVGSVPAMADEPTRVLVLRVHNLSGIGQYSLEEAQRHASQIYEAIGVSLIWVNDGADTRAGLRAAVPFQVALLSRTQTEKLRVSKAALGVAPLSHDRAYIFCERIAALSARAEDAFATILGRVLAHEVGHLVLPGKGHSETGIMRANLDYTSRQVPGFTDDQAASIRVRLTATR